MLLLLYLISVLGGGMRSMGPLLKLIVLFLLLGFVPFFIYSAPVKNHFGHCESIVKKWAFSCLKEEFKEDRHTLRDLLFFLHIPRTGGRTYFHCFLRKLYSTSQECPRSYDKLRFDPRKPKCRLLVTHDDYSVMSKLLRKKTSVVTILRNPVDRVFSTYEFAVEVAARFLVHPNLTSATEMTGRARTKANVVSTLDIWPWKYLVPWMRKDLFARRDGRKTKGPIYIKSNDPYSMKEIVMPLHEFINDPIAHEIVHNGATFQIAGLTNNSYLEESHDVRHCVQKYPSLGEYVLQVAKKRLDNMLYFGLTEDHKDSATMFANIVGSQAISQSRASNSTRKIPAKSSGQNSPFLESKADIYSQNSTTDHEASEIASLERHEAAKENMTVGKLMKYYEVCISSLRKTQSRRRNYSFKRIAPANFSKASRLEVSEAVLQQIKLLNSLDVELYKYAQDIFEKQHKHTLQKLADMESLARMFNYSYSVTFFKAFVIAGTIIILLVLTYLFVYARRKTSKVKI